MIESPKRDLALITQKKSRNEVKFCARGVDLQPVSSFTLRHIVTTVYLNEKTVESSSVHMVL